MKQSGPSHNRSKSHANISLQSSRGRGVHNVNQNERLPSIKSLRAGHTQVMNNTNSRINNNSTTSTSNGVVRKANDLSSLNVLKQTLDDHVSPLYTPAAITIEQVPTFLQD